MAEIHIWQQLHFSDKIRIRLKAYDYRVLDQSTTEIVDTAKAHRGAAGGADSAARRRRTSGRCCARRTSTRNRASSSRFGRHKRLIDINAGRRRSSFISASTVCGVGSKMSMRPLVRPNLETARAISCRRAASAAPIHLFFDVGSGIGPAKPRPGALGRVDDFRRRLIRAPRQSYAFRRIRILSLNEVVAICDLCHG